MSSLTSQKESETTKFSVLFKKLWPNFLVYNSFALSFSALYINIIIISNLIWPGETFHAVEIGILLGTATWVLAFSGIFFGYLADNFSRTKLMLLSTIMFGVGMLINGFSPEGQGWLTFYFFFGCNLLRGFFSGGFWPLINSYTNDAAEEFERSQFFGVLQASFQVFQIIGMVISAFLFQNQFWRQFFWGLGCLIILLGIIIGLKAKEPKRGATQSELKQILTEDSVEYQYELTKETFKTTILSPTNIIAFLEGIFTTIAFSVPDFLITPYIQSPPHNISPLITSFYMIIFGITGGVIGSISFAKLSDRLGEKNIKNRVYFIVFSIISIFFIYIMIVFLPLPNLTIAEGKSLEIFLHYPIFWVYGGLIFIVRSVLGLWNINQPPILQKINLPEAQGKISSANQFLEMIGSGTGPIIGGTLLMLLNQNYQITFVITMSIGIIGAFFWLATIKWIEQDVERISTILEQRAIELAEKNKFPQK